MCSTLTTKSIDHRQAHKNRVASLTTNEEILYGNPKQSGQIKPKCDPHQRHLPITTKDYIIKQLGGCNNLHQIPTNITNFEELYNHVVSLIGNIKGVGPLTIYDVATRIGAKSNIFPKDFVYLHAGPLKSAKHLHKIRCINLPRPCTPRVPVGVFSGFCPGMDAFSIEHELCIKKNKILGLSNNFNGTIYNITYP